MACNEETNAELRIAFTSVRNPDLLSNRLSIPDGRRRVAGELERFFEG